MVKKIFFLCSIILFCIFTSRAQISHFTACENDTVYLIAGPHHGTVVWQYAPDSLTWQTDTTNTGDTLVFPAVADIYYRFAVIDGSCDTVFSDIGSIKVYPPPTIAHAGNNQTDLPGFTFILEGNEPLSGNGHWQIISGTGGAIVDPTIHNTLLTGVGAHAYTLVWTIENECRSTSDTVHISFRLPQINCNGILYIHPTDNHGGAVWGCQGTVTNAVSDIDGASNTVLINNACNSPSIAAKICSELNAYGYSDWYLPAKDELNCLYTERNNIGGFNTMSGIVYWTSTETSANWAASQNFNNGQQANISQKQGACRIRCVRRD